MVFLLSSGRRLTPQGTRDLDRIAGQVRTFSLYKSSVLINAYQHLRIPKMQLAVVSIMISIIPKMN